MNKRTTFISLLLAVPMFLSVAMSVYAAPPTPPPAPAPATADMYTNPITYTGSFGVVDTLPKFLLAAVDLIFLIAVPIIVICIIYAGFVFVTAGDNESKIKTARTIITWTIIGAGVLLGAKAISLAVQNTICALDSTYSSYFCP